MARKSVKVKKPGQSVASVSRTPTGVSASVSAGVATGVSGDEWDEVSTALGVLYANRLNTLELVNAAEFPDGAAGFLYFDEDPDHAAPGAGGSAGHNITNAVSSSAGIYLIDFSAFWTAAEGEVLYWRRTFYFDDGEVLQPTVAGTPQPKIDILTDSAGINQSHEIVTILGIKNWGISTYAGTNYAGGVVVQFTDGTGTHLREQTAIDQYYPALTGTNPDDGAAWSAFDQNRRRFGPINNASTLGDYRIGLGDPISGAIRLRTGLWVFESRLEIGTFGSANSRYSMWVAPYGEEPILIDDITNLSLNGSGNLAGVHEMVYRTGGSPGGRQVSARSGELADAVAPLALANGVALGTATLEYNATTSRFRFKSAQSNYGPARGHSVANGKLMLNVTSDIDNSAVASTVPSQTALSSTTVTLASAASFPTAGSGLVQITQDPYTGGPTQTIINWTGKSGNDLTGCTFSYTTGFIPAGGYIRISDYIAIEITDPDALPTSGTTEETFTISDGRPDTFRTFGDLIISTNMINFPGGFAPPGVATPLSAAAQSLSAGQFAQLTTTGISGRFAPIAGGSILEYSDRAHWNPIGRTILVQGGAHAPSSSVDSDCTKFVSYSEDTNDWATLTDASRAGTDTTSFFQEVPQAQVKNVGHEYQHDTIDSDGHLYHRSYAKGEFCRFRHDTQVWESLTPIGLESPAVQIAGALDYFPDRDSIVFVDGDWGIHEYDIATDTWDNFIAYTNGGGGTPQFTMGPYHNVCAYSPAGECIVLGGGNSSGAIVRYYANGTFATGATAPVSLRTPDGGSGGIFVRNPVSGNILYWDTSGVGREYDPVADVWDVTGDDLPFAPTGTGGVSNIVACPIEEYGVIVFLKYGPDQFWLYRARA